MLHFFISIFKHPSSRAKLTTGRGKKIIIFLLLVFVVTGIISPHSAYADDECGDPKAINKQLGEKCQQKIDWLQTPQCAKGLDCHTTKSSVNMCGTCQTKGNANAGILGETGTEAVNSVVTLILGSILIFPLAIAGLFSFVAGALLSVILNIAINGVSYTTAPAVVIGWPIVRNFGNMVIILALIVIALATILRMPQEYEAKKLLPKLIIAALLINFSLVICGIFIDTSNVIMRNLLNPNRLETTTVGDFIKNGTELNQIQARLDDTQKTGTKASDLVANMVGSFFFFMVKGVISLLYVFLFLFRIFALWILVILSPLAFACYVLPITRSMVYKKWMDAFLQWCFIGVFGAIFISLANQIQKGMATDQFKTIATIGKGKPLAETLPNLFSFFVPGMFLVMGFIFSMQLAPMG